MFILQRNKQKLICNMWHFYSKTFLPDKQARIGQAALLKYAGLFLLVSFLTSPITAQKGNNNRDVTLTACMEDIGNGLYRAYFGYTNPTNKAITLDSPEDSYIFLSDRIEHEVLPTHKRRFSFAGWFRRAGDGIYG